MRIAKRLVSSTLTSLALGLLSVAPASAASASAPHLYFENSSVASSKGGNVHLNLRVDPRGTSIDTVSVVVSWNKDTLQFNGIDTSSSKFSAFVPAVPTSKDSTVEFSASSLGSAVTSDSAVTGLDFTSLVGSQGVIVGLEGSAAASNGSPVDVTTTDASVYLDDQTLSGNGKQAAISGIKVTNRSVIGATIEWQTAAPTTGSISYGTNTNYGLVANTSELSTHHSLPLQNVFRGKTNVHYRVQSRTEDGATATSADQQFNTVGYNVQVTVTSTDHQPLTDKRVSLTGQQSATTNAQGVATFTDVAAGTLRVHMDGQRDQFITVVAEKDAAASRVQSFNVRAQKVSAQPSQFLAAVLVVALLAAILALRRSHTQSKSKPAK